jgi:glyoxylase-like metal-dependent hydrolase (beta-lactamase superfamily II)
MKTLVRLAIAAALLLLARPVVIPLTAQQNSPVDLTGTWVWVNQEDATNRFRGVDPGGRYEGLTINDAARMRADTYSEEWVSTSPLLQCRPRGPTYQPYALDPVQIDKQLDPISRQIVAYRITVHKTAGARMIWLDARPRPSRYAAHSWEGASTGTFKGPVLEISTTHLKESIITRNGVPSSFRATVVEQLFLDEPYLHWVFTVIDPDYLTEPLVRSGLYVRGPTQQLPPYPCQAEDNLPPDARTSYKVPHYLPGENPWLTETAFKFKAPLTAWRGFAEALYPSWYPIGKTLAPPAAPDIVLKPTYNDESTRVAERADAQPERPAAAGEVEPIHVAGNVYLIGGAGGNIAASIGGDGVILVDTGAAGGTEKVLTAIRHAAARLRPPDNPESASPFNSTWQATHAVAEPKIRMIINTNDNPDHVQGNAAVRRSPMFGPLGDGPAYQLGTSSGSSQQNLAHVNVQQRMLAANAANAPTDTFFADKYTLYRFFNGQAVQIFHMPNAITDGDSIVWFRRSDVIVTGDIYNSDIYPPIDLSRGGSINGAIDALNKVLDMSVTEYMAQGGTMIVPGHGWISDSGDVGYYRDMLMIVRDRIQNMIDRGMSLDQVRAAKPTMDYDPLYGRQPKGTARFVEAVYESLKRDRATK